MEEQNKMMRISATIPEPLVEQLRLISKIERRSMSAQLALLIEEEIKRRGKAHEANRA